MSAAGRALHARLDGRQPRILLTLGSGLGALAEDLTDAAVVGFGELGLPPATVPGHAGRLLVGDLDGVPVLVQQGRLHLYEGHTAALVAGCVRAAAAVDVDTFVVTNAAGGLHGELQPGDLLAIRDQLNLTGHSPLVGGDPPQFVDLVEAYDPRLRAAAHTAAREVGDTLAEGVYAGVVGPAYETPAEARMLHILGADVVGMSTVMEVLAARACGLRVVGLSLVTNVHGSEAAPTDHGAVLHAARAGGTRLAAVLRALLPRLAT